MPTYLSPGVYVEEKPAGSAPIEGVGTAVAGFVGFAAQGPFNSPTLVTSWRDFTTTFGEFVEGSYLAHAVYGYFQNGGGSAYVVRVGEQTTSTSTPSRRASRAKPQLPAGPQAEIGGYRFRAVGPAARRPVAVEVVDAEGENLPDGAFSLVVRSGDDVLERVDAVTTKRGRDNLVTKVNAQAKTVTAEQVAGQAPDTLPRGRTDLEAPPAPEPEVELAGVSAEVYVGDAADRTGFAGLETVDEVTMLCVPDLMAAHQQGALDAEAVKVVQLGMIAHCELMGDRMAVLDTPPGLSPQQVKDWRVDVTGYDSKYAALYWPWVKVADPVSGQATFVPPSGHVAGVWARNDDTRGVFKAPANEVVRGAVALQSTLTRAEHDLLNPAGINCIRSFPGRGVRIWGARTLSSEPEWRYLNVRRLFNYLEESILNGTQWVVFEPNDDALWARIRRTISAFLVNEWRRGALFGLTPDEAFYVKCDRETNPAEGIDAGEVVCEVGVAPVKPAEFVVFRLSQLSGGTSLVAE